MSGKPERNARKKAIAREAYRVLMATTGTDLEEALAQATMAARALQSSYLTEAALVPQGKKGPLVEVLRSMFSRQGAWESCTVMDTVIAGGKGHSLAQVVGEALQGGYQDAVLRTIGVIAWKALGWQKDISQDEISDRVIGELERLAAVWQKKQDEKKAQADGVVLGKAGGRSR